MSYVAMEQNVCPICTEIHEHNTGILLDKRLKDIPDDKRVSGYGLCKTCDDLTEEYIALIGVDPSESDMEDTDTTITMENAYRTGSVIHVRRSVVQDIFNIEIDLELPFIFIEEEAVQQLIKEAQL